MDKPDQQPDATGLGSEKPAPKKTREELWAVIQQVQERNDHLDPDEVYADVTRIVEEVRQEMYEERQRAARDRR